MPDDWPYNMPASELDALAHSPWSDTPQTLIPKDWRQRKAPGQGRPRNGEGQKPERMKLEAARMRERYASKRHGPLAQR